MTLAIRNLKAASEEFVAATLWYEEQRPGLGGEFFEAVVHAMSFIQEQPEKGTPSQDRRTRRVLVQRLPYQIVDRFALDEIVIVAIAHSKRRPGSWRKRQ